MPDHGHQTWGWGGSSSVQTNKTRSPEQGLQWQSMGEGKWILSLQKNYMASISSFCSFLVCKKGVRVESSSFCSLDQLLQVKAHGAWSRRNALFLDSGLVTPSHTAAGQFHELRPGVYQQVPERLSCFCELSIYTSCRETVLLIATDSLKQHTSLTHHRFYLWKDSMC